MKEMLTDLVGAQQGVNRCIGNEPQHCDYVGCREVWRYNIQVSTSHLVLQWSSCILSLNKGEELSFQTPGFERHLWDISISFWHHRGLIVKASALSVNNKVKARTSHNDWRAAMDFVQFREVHWQPRDTILFLETIGELNFAWRRTFPRGAWGKAYVLCHILQPVLIRTVKFLEIALKFFRRRFKRF